MLPPLLLAEIHRMWYLVPLLVSVSLVYGATRHERFAPILEHAIRFGVGVILFLGILFAILWWITYPL